MTFCLYLHVALCNLVIECPSPFVDGNATVGARGDCISGACHLLHVSARREGDGRGGSVSIESGVFVFMHWEHHIHVHVALLYDYSITLLASLIPRKPSTYRKMVWV